MNRPAPLLPSARDARRELGRGASSPNLRPRVVIREATSSTSSTSGCRPRSIGPTRRPSHRHRTASPPRAAKDDLLADLASRSPRRRAIRSKGLQRARRRALRRPDPGPLPDLVPPSQLADPDSKFVAVDVRGTRIVVHYKEHVGEHASPETVTRTERVAPTTASTLWSACTAPTAASFRSGASSSRRGGCARDPMHRVRQAAVRPVDPTGSPELRRWVPWGRVGKRRGQLRVHGGGPG